MNRWISLLALIAVANLFACTEPVTFTEPQPAAVENLPAIPKRLQGRYIGVSDHSKLIVSDKLIQRISDYDYKFHRSELDSNELLSGDTIIDLKSNEKTLIRREKDSLIYHVHQLDTLFELSYDNVIRKFKGYYFLNIRYDKTAWDVKKMQLSKGRLIISSLSSKEDIDNLKSITETPQDTTSPYRFRASKKQFKEFIKNEGFRESEIFVKQKN